MATVKGFDRCGFHIKIMLVMIWMQILIWTTSAIYALREPIPRLKESIFKAMLMGFSKPYCVCKDRFQLPSNVERSVTLDRIGWRFG